jgi:GTP-dependent dephospho-CoA kinase
MYRLPDDMRSTLAKPIGKLFFVQDLEKPAFGKAITAPASVVSVGDRVTETLGEMGRVPDLQIVDGKENRKVRNPPKVRHVRTIRVRNPPGTITQQAMTAIEEAFKGKTPARVLVEGEEDLLAIPAIIFAPISTVVFYGQPGEGIVMVKVTKVAKARNRKLLASMQAESRE